MTTALDSHENYAAKPIEGTLAGSEFSSPHDSDGTGTRNTTELTVGTDVTPAKKNPADSAVLVTPEVARTTKTEEVDPEASHGKLAREAHDAKDKKPQEEPATLSDMQPNPDEVNSSPPKKEKDDGIADEATVMQLPPSNTEHDEAARLNDERDKQQKGEEEARMHADQEEQRQRNEGMARQQAEEEARMKADQEPERLEAETETRKMAEEEARIKAEQEPSRLESEARARSMAEEEARFKADHRQQVEKGQDVVDEEYQTRSTAQGLEIESEAMSDTGGDKLKSAKLQAVANPVQSPNKPNFLPPVDGAIEITSVRQAKDVTVNESPKVEPKAEAPHCNIQEKYDEGNHAEIESSTFCGITLADVFGTDEKEQNTEVTAQPRSSPVSFASAFGGDPEPNQKSNGDASFAQAFGSMVTAQDTRQSTSFSPKSSISSGNPPSNEAESSPGDNSKGDTSLTAFGAAKSKRVSPLVSQYMDNITKELLPGDAVKLESSSRSIHYSPNPSPISTSSPRTLDIEVKDLPKIGEIRAKFEDSSKSSLSNELLFGEAFRQKQRFSLLADKERKKEARMKMHGASYDALLLAQGKQATGEVDSSSIEKSFSFQMSNEDVALHDGSCKVDYQNEKYQGMVFVVHRTRGMLLFSHYHDSSKEKPTTSGSTRIPGGSVSEEEFLTAAKQTGYAKMQLQLAAREAAARQLFESTGIDMRKHLDRLTPAVLQMNPPVDAKGSQYLKNEHQGNLYYFLQIDDNDFINEETGCSSEVTTPSGEIGSPLKLKLNEGFADFTFVKDPLAAAGELKENGDPSITTALNMVMNQSLGQSGDPAGATAYEREGNTAGRVARMEDDEWIGGMTTVRDGQDIKQGEPTMERSDGEADLKQKASTDSAQQQVVTCCCSFW